MRANSGRKICFSPIPTSILPASDSPHQQSNDESEPLQDTEMMALGRKDFLCFCLTTEEDKEEVLMTEGTENAITSLSSSHTDNMSPSTSTSRVNPSPTRCFSTRGGNHNSSITSSRSHWILFATAFFLLFLSMSQQVSAKSEMMPEDDFDSSNKKVKFEDFDTNMTPLPASGGGTISTKDSVDKQAHSVGSLGLIHAFVASFSVIVVSELGDKTFFIAAIMAMRHSRLTVFSGAMSALALMTVLSALFGYATTVIPKMVTYYISTALFAIFGFKMLYDGYHMDPEDGSELDEVQAELRKKDEDNNDIESQTKEAPQSNRRLRATLRRILFALFSRVYLQALTMTFLAEWGDRSQIATIILAAREDVLGVCIGGVLGHSCCTGLAVLGGRMIAQKISVRTVTIIGGIVFLIFALTSLFISPD